MAKKKHRALDVKCPTCRSNPGAPCDGQSLCRARIKLAADTPDGRIDTLEKMLGLAIERISTLELFLYKLENNESGVK